MRRAHYAPSQNRRRIKVRKKIAMMVALVVVLVR
jgi:hypothetical protein